MSSSAVEPSQDSHCNDTTHEVNSCNTREGVRTRPRRHRPRVSYALADSSDEDDPANGKSTLPPADCPNPRIFTCVMCFEKAEDEHAHMEHLRASHPKMRTYCLACETQYNDYEEYKSHVQGKHPDIMETLAQNARTTRLYCIECGKVLKTESFLYRHRSQHFMLHRETCETCGKSVVEGPAMERHTEMHKAKVFACKSCNKTFRTARDIRAHSIRHRKYRFLCEVCGIMRPTAVSLQVHLSSVHLGSENLYRCSVCDKRCRSKDYLRKHMMAKHGGTSGEQTFSCEHCCREFKWRHNLKDHILLAHRDEATAEGGPPLLSCRVCDKKFVHKFALEAHMPTHKEYRDFRCQICAMAFKRKHALTDHINAVHSDGKKFQCSVCGDTFAVKRYLNAHWIKRHTDSATMHPCSECPKQFKSHKGLRAHQKTCHGKIEKKHVCILCGRAFLSPKDRRRHELTHEPEKKHECPHCYKMFSRADNLQKHIRGACRSKEP